MDIDTPLPIASIVIRRVGGTVAVATICGLDAGSVSAWKRAKSRKGTGGLIPSRHHAPLLAYARRHNIPLTPADLIPADPAGEVAA